MLRFFFLSPPTTQAVQNQFHLPLLLRASFPKQSSLKDKCFWLRLLVVSVE